MGDGTASDSQASEDQAPGRETSENREIRVRVSEEGACVRRLEVEVDARRVRRVFERAYRDLARQVRVRGFRPGKTPRSVLEKLYGASIGEQLEQTLVAETLGDAVELAGVEPASEPAIDAEAPRADAAFRYSARVEIKPELSLPELAGLPARRPAVGVEEAEIDRKLEELRQRNAPVVELGEGTPIEAGQIATLDFVGRIDGLPFEGGSGQGVDVDVGAGRMLPGFEEQLLGACAGDDREIRVSFPEDSANPRLAGKQAVFAAHVVELKRRVPAPLDDEFAKDLGDFGSLAELRERIRHDLLAARERYARAVLRASLMDSLIARAPFAVPPGMVQQQLERQLEAAHQRLHGAVPHASLDAQLAHWREEWRERAEREVRERLLLEAVARAHSIAPEDAEVDARLAQMAAEQGVAPARLRERYGVELMAALRAELCEEKTLEFLAAQAKVEETTGS